MKHITWLLLFAIIFGGIAWRVHYRRNDRTHYRVIFKGSKDAIIYRH